MERDDLGTLSVSPSDRSKLESMGLTTIEQIALADDYKLGMGDKKGKALVDLARNIIFEKHVEDVDVSMNRIQITLDAPASESTKKSVLSVLSVFPGPGHSNSIVENFENTIIISNDGSFHQSFPLIEESARARREIIVAKKRNELGKEGITLNEAEIIDFARQRGFQGFCDNVFGDIVGNEFLKQALAVSLFSSYEEPNHLLILGDPASSKTVARDIILANFKDVTNIGSMSTRAGLVYNMATGEKGALVYSDKKLVLVDEFDKIPSEDVDFCYELLSNGTCAVHSSRFHENIVSHFIMIAFGNPKHGTFTGESKNDIDLPPTLMSRFSLIIKTEILSEEDRKAIFAKKLSGSSELQKLPDYYDQWVKLARLHQPSMKISQGKQDIYIDELNQLITRFSADPVRRDLRMADYSARVPRAIARSDFSDVTDSTLDKALLLFKSSMGAW